MAGEFLDLINDSDLDESDRQVLVHAYRFLNGECTPHFASRSVLLMGNTGIGKTYLAERLLSSCPGWKVVVAGASRLKGKDVIRCVTIKEVVAAVKSTGNVAVLIDDLDYVMEKKDFDYVFSDKKELMELLEELKMRTDAFLIVTVNNDSLDPELFDRFDARIEAGLPSDSEKKRFLTAMYSSFVPAELLEKLTALSIGYNFRDIAEITRTAYRFGNSEVTGASVSKALASYRPGGLRGFDIKRNIRLRFADMVGNQHIKNKLRRLIAAAKKPDLAGELGLKRHNMLLFTGPNGTGKTAMAKAFAGELDYPLISVDADILYSSMGPYNSLKRVFKIASRYRESVVVFDEADKTLGRARFEDDNTIVGALNRVAEGFENSEKAIIILIANNEDRLGSGVEDRFTKISFDYPESDDRADFFGRKIAKATKVLDGSIGSYELAMATEGKSFREMEKLWEEIIQSYLETNERVGSEKFSRIVAELWKGERPLMMFG